MYRQSSTTKSTQSDPHELVSVLPTVWASASDVDTVKDLLFGVQQLGASVYDYAGSLKAAIGLDSIEPAVPVEWYRIVIKESALTSPDNLVTYGSGVIYGQGASYGQVDASKYAWIIPSDIVEIGLIQDSALTPSVVIDPSWFSIESSKLVFRKNPFNLMVPTQVGADREITLWCRNVLVDRQLPYQRYGAVLGMTSAPNDVYVKSLQKLWQLALCGPSAEALSRAIHAALGISYCEGNETVELVDVDTTYAVIVTDKNVYRLHKSANVLVQAGDVLTAGQSLGDTLRIVDLSSGVDRNWHLLSDMPTIVVSSAAHNNGGGQLGFVNKNESWTLYAADDVRCTIAGATADVSTFWSNVKSRGLASTTLASKIGMTGASSSSAVNPMKFLLDVVGANTVIVRIRMEHALALSTELFKRLPSLLPDYVNYVFCLDVEQASDTILLDTFTDTAIVVNAAVALDTMSTSGYDLSYTDYAPLVTAS